MNAKELEDVIRTAAVIRTARKLRGKTQIEVATHLGVSQSFLSKLEHGRLIPSSSQWFLFCQKMSINPSKTFETGFIDHRLSVALHDPYPQSLFKLNPQYSVHAASKVRSIRPFIQFFVEKLGEAQFIKFCNDREIDPDFFRVFDNQINLTFTLDLVTFLMQKGVLTENNLANLVRPINEPQIHGILHEDYDLAHNALELIRYWIKNKQQYETNFEYHLEEKTQDSLVLSVSPTPILAQFDYKNSSLGDFLCQYKQHYFKQFASYNGHAKQVSLIEKQCHYHGHEKCIYELKVAS